MITSTIVYMPRDYRKARLALALVRDAEYQMALRASRKGAEKPIFGKWRNCRCDPGIWELAVLTAPTALAAPMHQVSFEELRANETTDQNILNTVRLER